MYYRRHWEKASRLGALLAYFEPSGNGAAFALVFGGDTGIDGGVSAAVCHVAGVGSRLVHAALLVCEGYQRVLPWA